jgi:Zn-dependent peptidase ImmA (M78 family)
VTEPDDSSLDPDQRRAVEERARSLLDRASAWDRFPTPVDDLLDAAEIQVAASSVFDPAAILSYLREKAVDVGHRLKSAVSKVLGLYDAHERIIHIDDTVVQAKQKFLKLHETGHHELPTHRKTYRIFQDCEKTLDPATADLFEREANSFARFVLFQGDGYARLAADCTFELKTPMKLAKKFGSSVYASVREFARTNQRACVVYVLEPIQYVEGAGARAAVRRIEASPTFIQQFGRPNDAFISLDHPLGPVLPIGRKMTRPFQLAIEDRNGVTHECLAEAFDTTYNILMLIYPTDAMTATTIVMPARFNANV